ncbi:hypothetical protein SAMN06296036_10494 [Pseudobacteriovorax antillogorgiicola]|uniref:Uncharacterized protein n=1 Tax=Pseudobacteriovorax antillogorgiicola TaxID=1513793 RepID=A0A1Y6BDK4_9BACT|nr:hypothetical protein EDD56_104239 [Pseudobacteriovorax antillogorgiicola]SMF05760.1 hypothetical protein SAMN06296036_10494 [Pseudobacteriovorax antillogorgiicola]
MPHAKFANAKEDKKTLSQTSQPHRNQDREG